MKNSYKDIEIERKEYQDMKADWQKVRDCIAGQSVIKSKTTTYLARTPLSLSSGEFEVGDIEEIRSSVGLNAFQFAENTYNALIEFSEFPEFTAANLNALQGMIHKSPPIIKLPKEMEYLIDSATFDNKGLAELYSDATREVFKTGRLGFLVDIWVGGGGNDRLYISKYNAESIINWRKKDISSAASASMVVLREEFNCVDPENIFSHKVKNMYRGLFLQENGIYAQVAKQQDESKFEFITPSFRGRQFVDIPFVIVTPIDLEYDISPIPLLPMCNKALRIYSKKAYYNRAVQFGGDPTTVFMGVSDAEMPIGQGAGVAWSFQNPDVKVSLLETNGTGAETLRKSIMDDFDEALAFAGRIFDNTSNSPESGKAKELRHQSQQITTVSIAVNVAAGIERALNIIAEAMGIDTSLPKNNIQFKPNTEFAKSSLSVDEISKLFLLNQGSGVLSNKTIHKIIKDAGHTKLTYEDEQSAIKEEGDVTLGLIGQLQERE